MLYIKISSKINKNAMFSQLSRLMCGHFIYNAKEATGVIALKRP